MARDVNFGEGVDLVVGLTATALAADQARKLADPRQRHKAMHLAGAGLGAAVATTAFSMMAREHRENQHHHNRQKERHDADTKSRGRPVFEDRQRWDHGYVESLDGTSDAEPGGVVVVTHPGRGASLHSRRRDGDGDDTTFGSRSRSRSPLRSRPRSRSRSGSRGRPRSPGSEHGRRVRARSDPGWVKFLDLVKDTLEERSRR